MIILSIIKIINADLQKNKKRSLIYVINWKNFKVCFILPCILTFYSMNMSTSQQSSSSLIYMLNLKTFEMYVTV
jgi:hypothetical protein